MICIEQWRSVIGSFLPRAKRHVSVPGLFLTKTLCVIRHRMIVALFIISAMAMLANDIEMNPGPETIEEHFKILSKNIDEKFSAMQTQIQTFMGSVDSSVNKVMMSLDEVKQSLNKVNDEVEKLKRKSIESDNLIESLKKEVTEIKETLNIQQLDVDAVNDEIGSLNDRFTKIEEEIENQQRYSRRENIIFHGLPENSSSAEGDEKQNMVRLLNKHVSGKSWSGDDFTRVHRLGRGQRGGHPRPVIARFTRHDDKFLVFGARENLKTEGISVSSDLTPKQRSEIKKLRDEGKKAFYKGGRLHIDDGPDSNPDKDATISRTMPPIGSSRYHGNGIQADQGNSFSQGPRRTHFGRGAIRGSHR